MSVSRYVQFIKNPLLSYYLYVMLSEFVPIYPVYMIMFVDRGFSYVEISLLISIWSVPAILLEVPSGVLADRWSRKRVLALGDLLKALCFVVWAVSPSFAGAAAGFALWGAGGAFRSGATEAHLYDILKKRGREGDYESVAGRAYACAMIATAAAMAVGGAVYSFSPGLALGISAANCVAACLLALGFEETARTAPPEAKREPYFGILREGLRECFRNAPVTALILAGCIAGSAYGTIDEYDTLWARETIGVPLRFVGWWGGVRLGIEALGGGLAATISSKAKLGRNARLAVFMVMAGSLMALAGFFPATVGLPAYFLFYFMMAAGTIMMQRRLQDAVERAGRATVLSLASLAMTLTATILSPGYGILADNYGLKAAVLLTAALTAAAALAFTGGGRRRSP